MTNIINFDSYRERKDPDYALDFVSKRNLKIDRIASKKYKKALNLNDIKYIALSTLLVIGEVICTIGIANAIKTNTWDEYHIFSQASTLGFLILPGVFFVHKKEILDAFTNLCYKFKQHKKQISKEELEIFKEELEYIVERQKLENLGFTMFDDNHRRR